MNCHSLWQEVWRYRSKSLIQQAHVWVISVGTPHMSVCSSDFFGEKLEAT